MKIEVWSDFVCPFCYTGKHRLAEALAQFPHRDQVEIIYRSFQLNPDAEKNTGMTMYEQMIAKGRNAEQAQKAVDYVTQRAAEVGLTFRLETIQLTNTFDAHRLMHYAKTLSKEAAVVERIFAACFTESQLISDRQTLASLAAEVGLDRSNVLNVLEDESAFADNVHADRERAKEVNVTEVPFYVINGQHGLIGGYPAQTYVEALQAVWDGKEADHLFEQTIDNDTDTPQGMTCTADGCQIAPNAK